MFTTYGLTVWPADADSSDTTTDREGVFWASPTTLKPHRKAVRMPIDKKTLFASQDDSLSLSPRSFSSELAAYAFAMGNIGIGTIRDSCNGGHGNFHESDWLVSHAADCDIIVWARLSM